MRARWVAISSPWTRWRRDIRIRIILKLQKADLLVVVGRELEIGWLPPLIQQSRNGKIQQGAPGYLDASLTAQILEIPSGNITRAEGDVHPFGDPHIQTDPHNIARVAAALAQRLAEIDPANAATYQSRYKEFAGKWAAGIARWVRTSSSPPSFAR